ncbi:hypothetical protein KEM52_003689 [Ascosphaera acerosa]|nr:hypothetical protein KEM52_003689 [Ascosphaera acerosa]
MGLAARAAPLDFVSEEPSSLAHHSASVSPQPYPLARYRGYTGTILPLPPVTTVHSHSTIPNVEPEAAQSGAVLFRSMVPPYAADHAVQQHQAWDSDQPYMAAYHAGSAAPILHNPVPVRGIPNQCDMSQNRLFDQWQASIAHAVPSGNHTHSLQVPALAGSLDDQAITAAPLAAVPEFTQRLPSAYLPRQSAKIKVSPTPPTPTSHHAAAGSPHARRIKLLQYTPRVSHPRVNAAGVRATAELYFATGHENLSQAYKALNELLCQRSLAHEIFLQSQEPQNLESMHHIWGTYCADMRCMHDMIHDTHYIFLKLLRDALRVHIARRGAVLGSKAEDDLKEFELKVLRLKCHLDRFTLPTFDEVKRHDAAIAAGTAKVQARQQSDHDSEALATPHKSVGDSLRVKRRRATTSQTPRRAPKGQSSP